MKLEILSHEAAKRELLNLPRRRAEIVDRAVLDFATSGAGMIRRIATDAGPEYRLAAGGYEVRFSVDRAAGTKIVWAVWPAPRR
jgi:hypothetical protein